MALPYGANPFSFPETVRNIWAGVKAGPYERNKGPSSMNVDKIPRGMAPLPGAAPAAQDNWAGVYGGEIEQQPGAVPAYPPAQSPASVVRQVAKTRQQAAPAPTAAAAAAAPTAAAQVASAPAAAAPAGGVVDDVLEQRRDAYGNLIGDMAGLRVDEEAAKRAREEIGMYEPTGQRMDWASQLNPGLSGGLQGAGMKRGPDMEDKMGGKVSGALRTYRDAIKAAKRKQQGNATPEDLDMLSMEDADIGAGMEGLLP